MLYGIGFIGLLIFLTMSKEKGEQADRDFYVDELRNEIKELRAYNAFLNSELELPDSLRAEVSEEVLQDLRNENARLRQRVNSLKADLAVFQAVAKVG